MNLLFCTCWLSQELLARIVAWPAHHESPCVSVGKASALPLQRQASVFKGGTAVRMLASPSLCLGFNSPTRRHKWFFPCSEQLFSGYSGFTLSSKTNISKFQFDLESKGHRLSVARLLSATLTKHSRFIYLFQWLACICNKHFIIEYFSAESAKLYTTKPALQKGNAQSASGNENNNLPKQ